MGAGFTPNRVLNIHNLAVAAYDANHASPAIKDWIAHHKIPSAELCSQHVIYGFCGDFESFPVQKEHLRTPNNPGGAYSVMHAEEAYTFLLALACGLESKRVAEADIRRQFFRRSTKHLQHYPEIGRSMRALVAQVRADSNFTFEQVLKSYSPPRFENAVRDISDQKQGDRALVIADFNGSKYLSTLTVGLMQVLNGRDSTRHNYITLTHPDDDLLLRIPDCLAYLEKRKKIRSGVVVRPFSELGALIDAHDKVYVVANMDVYIEADQEIINCWRARLASKGTLVHLNGMVKDSTDIWSDAELDNYFSPEDIRAEMARRGQSNAKIIVDAETLNRACARIRMQGGVPRLVLGHDIKEAEFTAEN